MQQQTVFPKTTASQNVCDKMLACFALILVVSFLFANAQAYMIDIDAGVQDECFHERVPVGVKLGFSYEVIEGGFYDIDVEIKDPNGIVIHQEEQSSNGKLTIEANLEGPYNFCFNNRKSSYTPKKVIFDIDRSDSIKRSKFNSDGSKENEETAKILNMVESLLLTTISSRHDVRYLAARDRVHKRISEATNSRIVWWGAVELLLLLVVALGQVWYLKRFFEIRRKV